RIRRRYSAAAASCDQMGRIPVRDPGGGRSSRLRIRRAGRGDFDYRSTAGAVMIESDGFFRAKELEAYERLGSLDDHGEIVRLILAEASLLAEKYRYVARHDVPHVRELASLIDLLWDEIEMETARL